MHVRMGKLSKCQITYVHNGNNHIYTKVWSGYRIDC